MIQIVVGWQPPVVQIVQSTPVQGRVDAPPSKDDIELGNRSPLPAAAAAESMTQQLVLPTCCMRDEIAANPKFYRFACMTGIIMPASHDSGDGKSQNWSARLWVNYLHYGFLVNTLFLLAYGIVELMTHSDLDHYGAVIACEVFGILSQHLLLIPALVRLRGELTATRQIDRRKYEEAFDCAYRIGLVFFIALAALLLVFAAVVASTIDVVPGLRLLVVLFMLPLFLPINCFLCGVLTFLVMEQRLSYDAICSAERAVLAHSITHDSYMDIRAEIDERDRRSPVNWMIFSAVFNTVFCMVLIVVAKSETNSATALAFGILYVLSAFGRQPIVLLLILFEMTKVNSLSERMLRALAADASWAASKEAVTRFNLYILMKESPLGSSLFTFRPSRTALTVQMASTVTGIVFSLFWSLVRS